MSILKTPLILWGGIDIDPIWYGEERHPYTQQSNLKQDRREFIEAINAVRNKIPIIGVCRGAQLLCILNKGKLHQHTVPHKNNHSITTKDGHNFDAPGAHHQIMVPNEKSEYELIAWNPEETSIWTSKDTYHKEHNCPEVIWFPKTLGLAIQPHPEWCGTSSYRDFRLWINKIIKEKGINYEF